MALPLPTPKRSATSQHEKLVKQAKTLVAQTFFGTLMKQMRDSPFKSSLFDGGRGGEAFGAMYDQQLAEKMSSGAGKQLVNSIVNRLEARANAVKHQVSLKPAHYREDQPGRPEKGDILMSRLIADLESILQQLIVEHRKLLKHVDCAPGRDEDDGAGCDGSGGELSGGLATARHDAGESRRRTVIAADCATTQDYRRNHDHASGASSFRSAGMRCTKLREELKKTILADPGENAHRRSTGWSLLGHLNTVVRLIAGAVERAGIYTKSGVPQVSTSDRSDGGSRVEEVASVQWPVASQGQIRYWQLATDNWQLCL